MSRKRHIDSFHVIDEDTPPSVSYISTNAYLRAKQYASFKGSGTPLPKYGEINRAMMDKEDLRVLNVDWSIKFEYRFKTYKLTLKRGYIWDGASIPSFLVFGRLTKNGQHIQIPAMVHDVLFNQHLLSYDDSNNVFRGLLNSRKNTSAGKTKRRYSFGVRSIVGKKSYKKNNPAHSWMQGYYTWEEVE